MTDKEKRIREILVELVNETDQLHKQSSSRKEENYLIDQALKQLSAINEQKCKDCKEVKLNTIAEYFKKYNKSIKPVIDEGKIPSEKELQEIQMKCVTFWQLFHAISIRLYPEGYIAKELKKTDVENYNAICNSLQEVG